MANISSRPRKRVNFRLPPKCRTTFAPNLVPAPMKVLLIEPEAELTRLWQALLLQEAHLVDIAFDGKIGYRLAVQHGYDGIILHLSEPVTWVRQLRQQPLSTPVLILLSPTDNAGTSLPADVYWVDYYRLPWQTADVLNQLTFLVDRRGVSS